MNHLIGDAARAVVCGVYGLMDIAAELVASEGFLLGLRCIGVIVAGFVVMTVLMPDNMLKILSFILRRTFIRVREQGVADIPESGPVLLVSNHISLLDMLLIQSICRNRVRFMVRTEIINFLPTRFIFWYLGVIRVPNMRHPKEMQRFFQRVRSRLRNGETLCFFPEGAISGNGNLMRFRSGVAPLVPRNLEVTILPVRIGMLHGRLFSAEGGKLRFNWPRRLPINFSISVGDPIKPDLSAFQLRQTISEIGAEAEKLPQEGEVPFHTAFVLRAKHHFFQKSFTDAATGVGVSNFSMLVRCILLSRKIRDLDRGENGYVGVLLPNSTAEAATLLAVLCADRTPGVINYSAGEAVALESARRAGIKTILTSRRFVEKIKWQPSLEMIFLEDVASIITRSQKFVAIMMALLMPRRKLVRRIMPMSCYNIHHQAVLLFSSGSTGVPKGVMLTHRNINCDIWSFIRMLAIRNSDRFVGNLPLFHAYGFTCLFAFPALVGMPVYYILNPLGAADVVKAIARYKLTLITATPTFLQTYLHKATAADLETLRLIVTGGEKLRPELAEKFHAMTGKVVVEGYGCTELSPIVTVNFGNSLFDLASKSGKPGSIGSPLPGIHIKIVDPETGVELGPGESGRMLVKGGTVMSGYLNMPEQTARVIQNGYYDTGDIARLDSDGYVYITGRASRFSKIGGEMVPHETLEEAISHFRGSEMREVAITGKSDPKRGEKLIVFYTPEDLDPAEVIRYLKEQKFPNLWIPKEEDFVRIAALPLLGSGKLDIRKLNRMAETGEYDLPDAESRKLVEGLIEGKNSADA